MKTNNLLTLVWCAFLLVAAGCELDQLNPNAPTEAQVLSTPEGIKALAVGLQAQYGEGVNENVEVSNFLTRWYATMPSSVLGLRELETGGSDVQGFNGTVNNMWSTHYRTIKSAEDLITNAPKVTLVDGTRSGIIALAKLYKAMSIGELIECYEQVPIEVTSSLTPTFANRTAALDYVISLLEQAQQEITATPPSADFNASILGIGFDLTNTIRAMIARYALIKGDHDKALSAANLVDLTKTSSIFYNSSTSRNPIYLITIQLVYYRPVRTWRTNAEAGDGRVAYWVSPGTSNSFLSKPVDDFNQFKTDNAKFYVYLPGEITLIKAEAYARKNDLANALIELNKVRTKATDPAGIGAGLPPKTAATLPNQGAMLDEIFKQRQYELFITGLLLGDSRRFSKPQVDRTRNWLPFPDTERLSNPNTPTDPAF
ncbi:MAG: RagB/SusD family nutrient uptake outer membrane protein [Ignavibacteriales bacterium]|nr:RagB/SusD family nutrient uptake outer membrane protein [Ignavibacteriales bacterium]